MKLLICDRCHDVVGLAFDEERGCKCGASHGAYIDDHTVEVQGPCRVIGLSNQLRYGTTAEGMTWTIREPHRRVIRRNDLPLEMKGGAVVAAR